MLFCDTSFATAQFISTTATIQTTFVASPKTTIGIFAAVLVTQGDCAIASMVLLMYQLKFLILMQVS